MGFPLSGIFSSAIINPPFYAPVLQEELILELLRELIVFEYGSQIFGGTTPKTVSSKEWWEETDKKFQAWPRTAGPPVVMNPISRQNFIVISPES
ncbi:hypothetical protein Nepgr_013314 [Nepenthes gracilis]|uniref:Uncharacterized protein n=1 Tax=Nepenthes gracilis TaxID=150966 RepID=A0AAD3XNV9_NEPGR|nr:hypothetical protein Nepgr_013314 [Nepenthes gracilis]